MNLAVIAALIATFHVPYALDSFDEPKPVAMVAPDDSTIAQIRLEIRRRVRLFQSCANAAKRRGVFEVRRLQATWSVAPDGNIKTMKIEGVTDRDFTVCLARAGNRPFPVKPGMEVTIPVPVVFVRY
jgi:hypothetical protein